MRREAGPRRPFVVVTAIALAVLVAGAAGWAGSPGLVGPRDPDAWTPADAGGGLLERAIAVAAPPRMSIRLGRASVSVGDCLDATVRAPAGTPVRLASIQRRTARGWRHVLDVRIRGRSGKRRLCFDWMDAGTVALRAVPDGARAAREVAWSYPVRLRVRRPWWARRISRIVRGRGVSVSVGIGEVFLYRHADTVPRVPASNEKLLLSMALLDEVRPTERLVTRVASQPFRGKVIRGRIWLLGGGDPWLDRRDLRRLARGVRRSGVRRITGRVVGSRGVGWRTAASLASELRRVGVRVKARPRTGFPPSNLGTLARVRSSSLGTILRSVNVHSTNSTAEALGRLLGARATKGRATRAAGAMAIRRFAANRGVTVHARDASGLSWGNRVTAAGLVRLLEAAERERWGAALKRILPGPGEGTLGYRLRGLRVRAKTGTLGRSVSALSGYVWLERGRRWARFSILSQGMSKTRAVRIEDRIVRTIARHAG